MISKRQRKDWAKSCLTIAVVTAGISATIGRASAQNFPGQESITSAPMQPPPGSSQVTMTLFKIEKNHGQKFLVTQSGDKIPVSGDQLAKDAASLAVYRDANANYWFINKYGNPTSIPPEKVQWAINIVKSERAAEFQGLQPGANTTTNSSGSSAPVQQTTIIQNPNGSSNGSGAGMAMTAAAAMGGGLLGGMIGGAIDDNNHYYGMPYGAPMYHDGAGMYHYNSAGNRVYVNNEHTNQVANQFNNVGDWDHRNQWQNNMQNHPNAATAANNGNLENHAKSFSGSHEGWGGFHHFDGDGFHGGGFRRR
ncbi:MAG TPA: hypothetical protein V6C69_15595 [Trichormus sp.]|jgi:hypothetical protein